VFLDRDGVINVNPPRGEYVQQWSQTRLVPGIADWIKLFHVLGYLVIVVTNQRGVALGRMTLEELERVHAGMREALAAEGAAVDDIFYCPHDYGACNCRKPLPGMVDAAVERWGIDLSRSILIGDSDLDAQLAASRGLPFVRVDGGRIAGGRAG
jgi:D-glycero-D-manno-heptose 1,7-bisphosphate phosphatase